MNKEFKGNKFGRILEILDLKSINKSTIIIGSILAIILFTSGYVSMNNKRIEKAKVDYNTVSTAKADVVITPTPAVQTITVHIKGEVNNPNVYKLSSDSRIEDAIEIAGGTTSKAMVEYVNLAEKLTDGQEIIIPSREQIAKNPKFTVTNKTSTSSKGSIVNINTANIQELCNLPGIGEATAKKIIDYRNTKGRFNTKEDIMKVNGIGPSKFQSMKDLISI